MGANFINIELEVHDSSDLGDLAAAFGKKFSVNYCGELSRRKYLLSGAFAGRLRAASPNAIARGLCQMIKELKPSGRKIWNRASDRVFDVGFDATTEQRATVDLFDHATVSEIGKLGARVAVSVYTHDVKMKRGASRPDNKRLQRRKRRKN